MEHSSSWEANILSTIQQISLIWWNLNSVRVLQNAADVLHTCLSWCAPAVEAAHPINASGTIEASSTCAVINIDTTVWACPAINTDAWEATDGVRASGTILTHTGSLSTLIHILLAQLSHVRGWAQAGVPVDIVHTCSPILAQVARTIINVLLAVLPTVTCNKEKECHEHQWTGTPLRTTDMWRISNSSTLPCLVAPHRSSSANSKTANSVVHRFYQGFLYFQKSYVFTAHV